MKIIWDATGLPDYEGPLHTDVTFYPSLSEKIACEDCRRQEKVETYKRLLWKPSGPSDGKGCYTDWEGDAEVLVNIRLGTESVKAKYGGRAHVGAAYAGKFAAMTIRGKWTDAANQKLSKDKFDRRPIARYEGLRTKFTPQGLTNSTEEPTQYLFGVDHACQAIWDVIYAGRPESDKGRIEPLERGVLIVSGRTGACKSQVARGLVHLALVDAFRRLGSSVWPPRNFHVLTLEDPIEERLFTSAGDAAPYGIDYTPRALGTDLPKLADGLRGAKRQTPSIVYVGEVRGESEWSQILDFAEGGHLLVVTTHAGSIVECFQKLIGDQKDSPELRSRVAVLTRAIVHLRTEMIPCGHPKRDVEAVLPSVWRRTPDGIASFVSNGYSSVLPTFCGPRGRPTGPTGDIPKSSSIGRRWFGMRLTAASQKTLTDEGAGTAAFLDFAQVNEDVEIRATGYDLRGL